MSCTSYKFRDQQYNLFNKIVELLKPIQPKFHVLKTPGLDNSDEEMSEGILR